jgi:hypothetical protein
MAQEVIEVTSPRNAAHMRYVSASVLSVLCINVWNNRAEPAMSASQIRTGRRICRANFGIVEAPSVRTVIVTFKLLPSKRLEPISNEKILQFLCLWVVVEVVQVLDTPRGVAVFR